MAQRYGIMFRGLDMKRVTLAILLALSTLLAGCFGGGENVAEPEEEVGPIWENYDPHNKIGQKYHF